VENQRKHILRSANETVEGEALTIRLHQGQLVASVVSSTASNE
jgi:hypothetical protein